MYFCMHGIYVCVCMCVLYVFMYACMPACRRVYQHAHMHVGMSAHISICICSYIHAHVYAYTHVSINYAPWRGRAARQPLHSAKLQDFPPVGMIAQAPHPPNRRSSPTRSKQDCKLVQKSIHKSTLPPKCALKPGRFGQNIGVDGGKGRLPRVPLCARLRSAHPSRNALPTQFSSLFAETIFVVLKVYLKIFK
jgi:hypothetical protein